MVCDSVLVCLSLYSTLYVCVCACVCVYVCVCERTCVCVRVCVCVCVCGRYKGRQWHSKIDHYTRFEPMECSISKYSFQTMLNVTRMCAGSLG